MQKFIKDSIIRFKKNIFIYLEYINFIKIYKLKEIFINNNLSKNDIKFNLFSKIV